MNTGRLIVVCAHSGGGKTTVCRRIISNHKGWRFSVSATTRPKRSNEAHGRDYYFLTDEQFDEYIKQNEFVEWEHVHGYRYGSLVRYIQQALDQQETLLLDIDVKGGVNIKNAFPEQTTALFLDTVDLETLETRLRARGTDNAEVIAKRLSRIPEERAHLGKFDHIIINDNLDSTINQIEHILKEDK